ncbi:unnamed protein product [Symbiodinium natans]|uniref:Uncharacterized protein n=1 Tax=Symbiodinium natans TaxID=878477 RepID=A0A812KLM2_9DINO|nr:unnamed protein product [Symbiodinium natans]
MLSTAQVDCIVTAHEDVGLAASTKLSVRVGMINYGSMAGRVSTLCLSFAEFVESSFESDSMPAQVQIPWFYCLVWSTFQYSSPPWPSTMPSLSLFLGSIAAGSVSECCTLHVGLPFGQACAPKPTWLDIDESTGAVSGVLGSGA